MNPAHPGKSSPSPRPRCRCAIYTRKSTEEGLQQEFNSLDAQREAGQAYIASQQQEGWVCLPDRYDDGGFTGGNMERPGLQQLLRDLDAGRIDCVLVYKVDRLSRSLLDFARMMEAFDQRRVAFVSVTQQFNTASSMGRLVLNVLLSFAQFEREIISERTRDKIAAARRKGKWVGGQPLLGYDVDPQGSKLRVNEAEAAVVRTIYELYLQHHGLLPVVQELEQRGWTTKRWTTRRGRERGGRRFTKTSLHRLLTNVAYTGKIRYRSEVHAGEHAAIVDETVWQRVQALLRSQRAASATPVPHPFGAVLQGLLRCLPCGCAMVPACAAKRPGKRYRYYVCSSAQKRGWHSCPSKSVPAAAIERFVAEQLRGVGSDPARLAVLVAQTHRALQEQAASLTTEGREDGSQTDGEVAEDRVVEASTVRRALACFDAGWESLTVSEQTRRLRLLVQRVDYDGAAHKVAITLHPAGIEALAHDAGAAAKKKEG